jgi:hypothetical protein
MGAAEEADGIHKLQGLHRHGHHLIGDPASVDYGAVHHPAESGGNHGVHRAPGQGRYHGGSLREVSSVLLLLFVQLSSSVKAGVPCLCR